MGVQPPFAYNQFLCSPTPLVARTHSIKRNSSCGSRTYAFTVSPLPGVSPPKRLSPRSKNSLSVLAPPQRSEEHTSELQSRENLVCRLLLEKKKQAQR